LIPVDIYCYLKARFGEPNGFQNFLRNDDSDNWIHWDFILKAGDQDVYVCGMSRETHFMMPGDLTDEDWRTLLLAIRADYKRVGKEKAAVLKSLERWVVFPNKFVEIAGICADLHASILDHIGGYHAYNPRSYRKKRATREYSETLKQLSGRAASLYKHCLELSLLTPVLAEAFINMAILILCKPEIRRNERQFEAFIRSQIDAKLFDMSYKCVGFARPIDPQSETFKNFKRVMDKRNNTIHGNCNPQREKIEQLYFEGKRPFYAEAGGHIGRFFEALERQYQPATVVKDYEDTHAFLIDIVACLQPGLASQFWTLMEDRYPGYDIDRLIMGTLLPDHVVEVRPQGVRYDDELAVTWE